MLSKVIVFNKVEGRRALQTKAGLMNRPSQKHTEFHICVSASSSVLSEQKMSGREWQETKTVPDHGRSYMLLFPEMMKSC